MKRLTVLEESVGDILSQSSVPVLAWIRTLGHMASMTEVIPLCLLHMRPLQWYLKIWWKPSDKDLMREVPLRDEVIQHLQWWLNRENSLRGLPFPPPQPEVTLYTDASDWGWGATLRLNDSLQEHWTQGQWSSGEAEEFINVRELRAVRLALMDFQQWVRGRVVLVHTDNTTALAYINREGGSRSQQLFQEAWRLFNWTTQRDITLKAVHVPGVKNVKADCLSRIHLSSVEWSLSGEIVNSIFARFGQPQVDLFASVLNRKVPVFCSFGKDPRALTHDAFSIPWTGFLGYAYPPFSLIPAVLRKVESDQAEVILVAPLWPRQGWFTHLLKLLSDHPRTLPFREDLMCLGRKWMPRRNQELLKLTVWRLSGGVCRRKDFRRSLQTWQGAQGESLQSVFIIPGWEDTSSGVPRRVWTPLLPL
jgi:hypothetical protein